MKKNKPTKSDYILYINTSKENELDVFLLFKRKIITRQEIKGNFKVSEKLLELIDNLLKRKKVKFEELTGIIAVSGPGPFTSIRVGIIIANTLSYVLQIPVIGLINKKQKLNNEQLIKLGLKQIKQSKIGKYISPFYNKEPNIIYSKKIN